MMGDRPFVLFLTGPSGAGKTTAYRGMREDPELVKVVIRDIDEDGVPRVGRGPWREFRVELLLHEALESLKNGISTVICGITLPHEVTWSKYYGGENVWIVALEVSPAQIRERLTERLHGGYHVDDESFNAEVIERTIQENIELQPRLRHAVGALVRGVVLDVSESDAAELHRQIRSALTLAGGRS